MYKLMTASAFFGFAAVALPSQAAAQYTGGNAPFCIRIYTSSNQIERCDYASFEQCQALNDGRNNTCFANPYYQPPAATRRR